MYRVCFAVLVCASLILGLIWIVFIERFHEHNVINTAYFPQIVKYNVASTESLYLTEDEIMKEYDLTDVRRCSYAYFSNFDFSPKWNTYKLGDEIRVEISLHDGYGKKKTRGGDYLRVWMENTQMKAAVSGRVIDHNNGSYTGVLKAVWSGEAIVGVYIGRRREEVALNYRLYSKYHTVWKSYADFSDGKTNETTLCSVAPFEGDAHEWCNLTTENDDLPWFCIKPKSPEISCHMWKTTWSNIGPPDGLTAVEQNLVQT